MKKIISVLLVLCLAIGLVAGCSDKKDEEEKTEAKKEEEKTEDKKEEKTEADAESEDDKDYYLGYSLCEYTMNLAAGTAQLFEEECEARGFKYTVTDAEKDASKQIDDINALINMGVDGIVVMAVDGQAVAPGVEAAYDAGIPIVVVLRDMPSVSDKYLAFCGVNDVEIGRLAGEWLVDAIDGKGKVVYLTGTPGHSTAIDRSEGFKGVLEEYPDIEIVAEQAGNWNRTIAMEVMEPILRANPEIDGVWCANDEMAGGAIQAIDAAGRSGEMVVGGANLQRDGWERLMSGEQQADITTPPQMVLDAIQALVDHLDGKEVEKRILQPLDIVTKENAAEFEYQAY
ncbi:MAG TPA: sugar ABC transporter substrate-binding protein [Clostridiaceae bacterium]|nr:sugar ABC transporter substrate-binding protein [Clostridiaceae bacterium]